MQGRAPGVTGRNRRGRGAAERTGRTSAPVANPLARLQQGAGNQATLALLGVREGAEEEPQGAAEVAAETSGRPAGRLRRITRRLRRTARQLLREDDAAEATADAERISALYAEGASILASDPPEVDDAGDARRSSRIWTRLLLTPLGTAQATHRRRQGRASPAERGDLMARYVEVLDRMRAGTRSLVEALPPDLRQTVGDGAEAGFQVAWAEAGPTTPQALLGRSTLTTDEAAAAGRYVEVFEAFLDDLLVSLPRQNLSADERASLSTQLQTGLRRAFVSIEHGEDRELGPVRITNRVVADKYRRVSALLTGRGAFQPATIITRDLTYEVPDDLPQLSFDVGVDLADIPRPERALVRFGIRTAIDAAGAEGVTLESLIWPVTFQVDRGEPPRRVRYELVFDALGNLRVERLGEPKPREVTPEFKALSTAEKKTRLIDEFGLHAIVDRPADPATGNPGAVWKPAELDQVKAAFDRLPESDRALLEGYTLARDHQVTGGGDELAGFVEIDPGPHDTPAWPATPLPHMHITDKAFANESFFVGAPGDVGPFAEYTLLHEVGHVVQRHAFLAARASIAKTAPATGKPPAAIERVSMRRGRQASAFNAWNSAQQNAANEITSYGNAMNTNPVPTRAAQAALRAVVDAAIAARDQARAQLAKAGFAQSVVDGAAEFDAAHDAHYSSLQLLAVAEDQIPIFIHLANEFGFAPFTEYARRGGDDEFFAETYALFLGDPDRLNAMNRRMFQWFEEGRPQDRQWRPASP